MREETLKKEKEHGTLEGARTQERRRRERKKNYETGWTKNHKTGWTQRTASSDSQRLDLGGFPLSNKPSIL